MKFHIVVPTYRRPAKLERLFNSILKQNIRQENAENESDQVSISLFIYFDNDDKSSYDYFKDKFGSYFKTSYFLLDKQYRAFGIWNRYLEKMEADAMFYVVDDIEFDPSCIQTAIEGFMKAFPDTDGILGLNQVNIPKDKEGFSRNAMGIIGKKFAERYPDRKCFCPDYLSFHADAELGNFARSIGKFIWCEEAKITHYHPTYFKDQTDETHNIVREMKKIDKEMWNLRQQKGLLWGHSFELVRK